MNKRCDILIIDDSEDDQEMYRRALEKGKGHYHVLTVSDGREGIAHLETSEPDCVLLDYSMPGYDGVEVLKRIRLRRPFMPVVMLTGQGNEEIAVNAIHAGAQDYICKGNITPGSLEQAIGRAVERCVMQERIHEQQTSLEIFTRALAHDLKEPVRTIRSFLDIILQREQFSYETRYYFQHIQKAANRMAMLIDTVHLYTRLDAGGITHEDCDLASIIREVKETLGISDAGQVQVEYGKLPVVRANRAHLMLVMQNLLANAIQYSERTVHIRIQAEGTESGCQITVSDNGPGIPPARQQDIFEPFKRITHSNEPHSGMGLAICRKIIESYGGTIDCHSELGKGTSIRFFLPRNGKNEKAPATADRATEHGKGKKAPASGTALAKVLLVDDNEADIDLTRILLMERKHLQCTFLTAYDGDEALAVMREEARKGEPVDLVLLDINMPMMNGFEMLEEIRHDETLRHTVVVMCSTSAYDKDVERSYALGAVGYLCKPPDFSKLQSIIDITPNLALQEQDRGFVLVKNEESVI